MKKRIYKTKLFATMEEAFEYIKALSIHGGESVEISPFTGSDYYVVSSYLYDNRA